MTRWSRRRALRAATVTLAGTVLAGCSESVDSTDIAPPRDRGEPITDYETTAARTERVFAPFWLETYEDDGNRPSRPVGEALLTEPPSEGSISFDPDADVAAALRSFVADTDFERECVVLWSTTLQGCATIRLTAAARRGDEVELSLCQHGRPSDVACERDAEHTLGMAIRLPFPGDDVRLGRWRVSGGCDGDPEPLTPVGGGGA